MTKALFNNYHNSKHKQKKAIHNGLPFFVIGAKLLVTKFCTDKFAVEASNVCKRN